MKFTVQSMPTGSDMEPWAQKWRTVGTVVGINQFDFIVRAVRGLDLHLEPIGPRGNRLMGTRTLRYELRRLMPMTSRMWKTRWQRATVSIRVGPSYQSRRQEAIEEFANDFVLAGANLNDPEYQARLAEGLKNLEVGTPVRRLRSGHVHWSRDHSNSRYSKRRR